MSQVRINLNLNYWTCSGYGSNFGLPVNIWHKFWWVWSELVDLPLFLRMGFRLSKAFFSGSLLYLFFLLVWYFVSEIVYLPRQFPLCVGYYAFRYVPIVADVVVVVTLVWEGWISMTSTRDVLLVDVFGSSDFWLSASIFSYPLLCSNTTRLILL